MLVPNINLILFSAAIVLLEGCKNAQTDQPRQGNKLGALAVFYGRYVATHNGKAPANQDELLSFVKKTGEQNLKQFGITHAEDLFTNDEEPIVVAYGQISATDPNPIVAYEGQPQNDKRKVLRSNGSMEEISESDFQQHRPAGSKR